ncbi:hypothetical protein FS749_016529 [Ceratobasidium sp. UAMH 11750]|nr:hypothetical protein FS749_016529 [Ceratobasidium sp. UAMH 11750]
MIATVGLATPSEESTSLFKRYKSLEENPKTPPGNQVDDKSGTANLRKPRIHFLGAWDTVPSIWVLRRKLLPRTNQCEHIDHFRHALAMDERRGKFMPEYTVHPSESKGDKTVKEVWFMGTHSDIGGGIDSNRSPAAELALLWMMKEAEKAGLIVDPQTPDEDVKRARIVPSFTGLWWIHEILPLTRLASDGLSTTNRWHLGRGRRIPGHHKIHYSAWANLWQARYTSYHPHARFEQWDWIFHDVVSPTSTRWEGDRGPVEALEIVQDINDTLIKVANQDLKVMGWLDTVNKRLRDGISAEFLWEFGGPLFLLKIAKFENEELVRGIVEAVLGTCDSRSTSKTVQVPSPEATTSGEQGLSEPNTNRVRDGIKRLPELLKCYRKTGPYVPISQKETGRNPLDLSKREANNPTDLKPLEQPPERPPNGPLDTTLTTTPVPVEGRRT